MDQIFILASNCLEKFAEEQDAKRELMKRAYIEEHGYLSISQYDLLSYKLIIICFFCVNTLIKYMFFTVPYTKQLIKSGHQELQNKLHNMYRIVVVLIVAIVAMGIYTIFNYSYLGYIGAIIAGFLLGILRSGYNEKNMRKYHEYHNIPYNIKKDKKQSSENFKMNIRLTDLKSQFRNIEFYKLVEEHINKQTYEDLIKAQLGYIKSLPLSAQPLIENYIDRWNIKGYDENFLAYRYI